jgi:hypothetical protein
MAQKRGRPSLPNKIELMEDVVRFRLEGETFRGIASKLSIDNETVHRYWNEYLKQSGETNVEDLLKQRRLTTERLLEKSLRSFYAGETPIKDVTLAMEQADKYNGLNQYLANQTVASQLPPLLEVNVHTVTLDLPPSRED